jgi:hypothetical protein
VWRTASSSASVRRALISFSIAKLSMKIDRPRPATDQKANQVLPPDAWVHWMCIQRPFFLSFGRVRRRIAGFRFQNAETWVPRERLGISA